MKAVVYDKRNSPNTLVLREIEKPIPADNEVLVQIYSVSVNAADYRSMKMGIIPKRRIFGADIAGRVEAIGKNISRLVIGDEVSIGNKKMYSLTAKQNRRDLEFIIKLVANGEVKPVIDKRYPLHETAEAVRYLSRGHAQGKVVIEIASAPRANETELYI